MNNCISQPQPVETSFQQEEIPPLEIITQMVEQKLNSQTVQTIIGKFIQYANTTRQDGQFQHCLKMLSGIFAKGYSSMFTSQTEFLKKMMCHFSKLSKKLQQCSQAETKMLFILSLIAEMIKQSSWKFLFPFTRKFLLNVFQIDNQLLESAPCKGQILAILAVIYQNLCQQTRLINKLGLSKEIKNALLTNYYLIDQLFTLKLFNRSILNLAASKTVIFTAGEFSKYSILKTISQFIAENQVEMFLVRMKTCMFSGKKVATGQTNSLPMNCRTQAKQLIL